MQDQLELEPNEIRVTDLPPGCAARIGDVAVFNVDGRFYATQARCTHRGGPLAEGELTGTTVTCPFHGARFDVCTGAVLRGPASAALETYPVHLEGGVARIAIEPEG